MEDNTPTRLINCPKRPWVIFKTQMVSFLLPENTRGCLGQNEALLQVTQHIIQHPHVGGVALFGVVSWPHHFWLEESCVVSESGGWGEQQRRRGTDVWMVKWGKDTKEDADEQTKSHKVSVKLQISLDGVMKGQPNCNRDFLDSFNTLKLFQLKCIYDEHYITFHFLSEKTCRNYTLLFIWSALSDMCWHVCEDNGHILQSYKTIQYILQYWNMQNKHDKAFKIGDQMNSWSKHVFSRMIYRCKNL